MMTETDPTRESEIFFYPAHWHFKLSPWARIARRLRSIWAAREFKAGIALHRTRRDAR
jgi:hypothetical protein